MSTKSVTKSIRLLPEEAEELSRICEAGPFSEAALMKKWVLEGMRLYKLEQGVQAYMKGEVDIREGAQMTGVSYNRFLRELERRHVTILDDPHFLEGLIFLGEAFEVPELVRAAQKVQREDFQSVRTRES